MLFEGTPLSIGRGTEFPFEVIGYPQYTDKDFSFLPESIKGKSEHPKFENQVCYGVDLRDFSLKNERPHKINLNYIIEFYSTYPDKDQFFTSFFNLLAGNNKLQEQIKSGKTEKEIRKSWEPELNNFKLKRKKYLLYAD